MAMNREELRDRIVKLPLFEMREVYVNNEPVEGAEVPKTKQFDKGICEIGKARAWAYVSPGYKLAQFAEDIFLPVLDNIEGEISGYLIQYGGYCALKIFPNIPELKEGNDEFGIIAANSVDRSSSIFIKFCVKHNEKLFTFPPKVAGLRKQHTGTSIKITQDYIKFIGEIKQAWKKIIQAFPGIMIVRQLDQMQIQEGDTTQYLDLATVLENLKLGKRVEKAVGEVYDKKTAEGQKFSLWDLFMTAFNVAEDRMYKSDVHKEKKFDTLSQKIFEYATILSL